MRVSAETQPPLAFAAPHPAPTGGLAAAWLPGAVGLSYGATALAGTVSLLYLTEIVHLPLGEVGAAMTAAGVTGMATGVAVGRLCDRVGARAVLATALAVDAAAVLALTAVDSIATCALTVCVLSAGTQTAYTARSALAAQVDPQDPSGLAARLYKSANIGFAAGLPLAGAVLADGHRSAYLTAFLAAAVVYIVAALCATRVHTAASVRSADIEQMRTHVWSDHRFLAVTFLCTIASLQYTVVEYGLPLWITRDTSAPRWTVAGSTLLSTLIVVLAQPAASRCVVGTRAAARAVAAASCAAALGTLALAAAAGHPRTPSTALVAAAAILLAAAEVGQVVGTLTLSYALAPDAAQGSYQGVFSLGPGLAASVGPLLLSTTVLTHGLPAWIALAAVIAAAGVSVPLVVLRQPVQSDARHGRTTAGDRELEGSRR